MALTQRRHKGQEIQYSYESKMTVSLKSRVLSDEPRQRREMTWAWIHKVTITIFPSMLSFVVM